MRGNYRIHNKGDVPTMCKNETNKVLDTAAEQIVTGWLLLLLIRRDGDWLRRTIANEWKKVVRMRSEVGK